MGFPLIPHPAHPPKSSFIVHVSATRSTSRQLALRFRIADSVPRIAWHEPEREGRADELWKYTCFEAFIRPAAREDYVELNLAPAKQWALYDLDQYRSGLRNSGEAVLRDMRFRSYDKLSVPVLHMWATLDLPSSFADVSWGLGLSIIIEEIDGTKSYWALAHAPGPPDFHNPDCFIAQLPAPEHS